MKRSISVALLLHGVIFCLLIFNRPQNPEITAAKSLAVRTLSQKDFERELSEALDLKEAKIVESDERLKSTTAPDAPKIRLSKTHQRVDAETKAPRVGRFKNLLREGIATPASESSGEVAKLFKLSDSETSNPQNSASTTGSGRLFSRQPTSLAPATAAAGEGQSATDDYLPDVAVGVNTLLNTHEYKFYSFYERIRRQLTEIWHAKLREEFRRIESSGQNPSGDHLTKLQVQLDARGDLKTIKLLGSSGVREFDRAATEAFQTAAPFPNPPTGMIVSDTVSIRWDFIVTASENSGFDVRIERGAF